MQFSLIVDAPPAIVFDAIGDFSNLAAWDPAVQSVELLAGDPMAVGARYRLVGSALGAGLRLEYEIRSIDRPNSVTYVGGTTNVTSTDTIDCRRVNGGTALTISSQLDFRGPTRWYGWAVRLAVWAGGRFVSLPALRRHVARLMP